MSMKLKTILKEQQLANKLKAARKQIKQKGGSDELIAEIESWDDERWSEITRSRNYWYNGKYTGAPGANPNSSSYNVQQEDIQGYIDVYKTTPAGLVGEVYLTNNNNNLRLSLLEQDVKPDDIKTNNSNMIWMFKTKNNAGGNGFPIYKTKWEYANSEPATYIPWGGDKGAKAWTILEIAKVFAEAGSGDPSGYKKTSTGDIIPRGKSDPIPTDFYKAMDYLINRFGKKSIKEIRPSLGPSVLPMLLRDKTTVWLIQRTAETGNKTVKTEWSAVPGLMDGNKTTIYNQSVYVGDANLNWLKDIPESQSQKVKSLYRITNADRITVELILAGNYTLGGGGTNEVWFKKAIDQIKGQDMVKDINMLLKGLLISYNASEWGPEDIYFLRNGKIIRKRNYPSELVPYPGSNPGGDPVANAWLVDQDIRNKADYKFTNLAYYIVNEFDVGSDRDDILNMLIKNKAGLYDPINNRCYIPAKDNSTNYTGIDFASSQESYSLTLPKNQLFKSATAEEAKAQLAKEKAEKDAKL